ncbi:hypothetical protein ACFY4C_28170 [Actinomadura viridis]|uniref:hypothetical protein n=1 Tax=Actinomadura viridis TaxID=58110 RepID=UPI00368872D4
MINDGEERAMGLAGAAERPDLTAALEAAGDDPRGAEARVVALAAELPARAVPGFLEDACLRFHAAGHDDLARAFLGRARKVEQAHQGLFGIAPDTARAHRTLLELVPTSVITPSLLHEHLTGLRSRLDPAAAHAEAREITAAFFDAGSLPYPNLLADLIPLAEAAGVAPADEEDFVAERLLRGGLLRRAALPVWEATGSALGRLCRGSAELLGLLIGSEPDPGVYGDPALDSRLRNAWLERLATVRAGSRLSRDWFLALAPAPADPLIRLADQAAERLFTPSTDLPLTPGSDPAVARSRGGDPLAFRREKLSSFEESGPAWYFLDDFAKLEKDLEKDPAAFTRLLDRFVRNLNGASNIDYLATLRRFRERPALRALLTERVTAWTAQAATGDLTGLEAALPHLVPLAESGYTELEPGTLWRAADPIEILVTALRSGIPEELAFPSAAGADGSPVTLIQHGDLLTLTTDKGAAEVLSAEGVVHRATVPHPPSGPQPWYDGENFYLSHFQEGLWRTLRVAGEHDLVVDPGCLALRPQAPDAAEVTFPSASEPCLVRLVDGEIRVSAPGGAVTARLRFAPVQRQAADRPLLPPPGWWPRLRTVDPIGSAALRGIERDTVERLVDAALRGPKAGAAELDRLLPWVTEPRLRQGVESLVRRAAECLPGVLRLHDLFGTDRPEGLPSLVRSVSGLRAGRGVRSVRFSRAVSEILADAVDDRRPDTAHALGTVELPPPSRGGITGEIYFSFGELGGRALEASWPWTPEFARPRLVDTLRAYGDTPWGDGTGRFRLLSWKARAGRPEPKGELWRTPNGSMVVLNYQDHPHKEATAIEYSPDGRFESFDLPGWAPHRAPMPQGWGGSERIARFDRLLATRGPAPYDVDGVRALAARTGLLVSEVASACFGYPYFVGREKEVARYPEDVLALFVDPETGERGQKTPLSYRLDLRMRQVLMPDDPDDLWNRGPDFDRAARWWETAGRDGTDA